MMEKMNMGPIMESTGAKQVAKTATLDIKEPTDRSSPPVRITKVWPKAAMPKGAAWVSRSWMLRRDKKGGEMIPATTIMSTKKEYRP